MTNTQGIALKTCPETVQSREKNGSSQIILNLTASHSTLAGEEGAEEAKPSPPHNVLSTQLQGLGGGSPPHNVLST